MGNFYEDNKYPILIILSLALGIWGLILIVEGVEEVGFTLIWTGLGLLIISLYYWYKKNEGGFVNNVTSSGRVESIVIEARNKLLQKASVVEELKPLLLNEPVTIDHFDYWLAVATQHSGFTVRSHDKTNFTGQAPMKYITYERVITGDEIVKSGRKRNLALLYFGTVVLTSSIFMFIIAFEVGELLFIWSFISFVVGVLLIWFSKGKFHGKQVIITYECLYELDTTLLQDVIRPGQTTMPIEHWPNLQLLMMKATQMQIHVSFGIITEHKSMFDDVILYQNALRDNLMQAITIKPISKSQESVGQANIFKEVFKWENEEKLDQVELMKRFPTKLVSDFKDFNDTGYK